MTQHSKQGGQMTPSQEAVERIVKNLFYLAHVEYGQEDAMANNPNPEEEAIRLVSQEIQKAEERGFKRAIRSANTIQDLIGDVADEDSLKKGGTK